MRGRGVSGGGCVYWRSVGIRRGMRPSLPAEHQYSQRHPEDSPRRAPDLPATRPRPAYHSALTCLSASP